MCRYLTADQFLGITFINLVKQDLFSIELPEINRIEKKIDSLIREKNQAVLCATEKDLYNVINTYNDFFSIKNNYIKIDNRMKNEKEELICNLQRYFLGGIPSDINETVNVFFDEIEESLVR